MKSKNCGCKLNITRTSQATISIYTGSLESVIGRRELACLRITSAGHRQSTECEQSKEKLIPATRVGIGTIPVTTGTMSNTTQRALHLDVVVEGPGKESFLRNGAKSILLSLILFI